MTENKFIGPWGDFFGGTAVVLRWLGALAASAYSSGPSLVTIAWTKLRRCLSLRHFSGFILTKKLAICK